MNDRPASKARSEPFAVLGGRFIPASRLTVSVADAGFMQGTTVAEQLRTFRGELFRLDAHLTRLRHSLSIVGVDPGFSTGQLADLAGELVARNRALLAPDDDLGLSIFVTPGPYPAFVGAGSDLRSGPMLGMHTYPLPFRLWTDNYQRGQSLLTASTRQVPQDCWPPELKCRSRMHYYLADRQAAGRQPGARAVLLDFDGRVTEASTANVIVVRQGHGLLSPPRESILPGISLETVFELAQELGLTTAHQPIMPEDLYAADELLLSSTSSCLLPGVEVDGRPIGAGRPGPEFQRLIEQWGCRVGVDIRDQARRFAQRS